MSKSGSTGNLKLGAIRILYGLPSEGMGHATRSKVMIKHLLAQGHEVKVATSDRAAEFLKECGFDILEIKGLHLKYKDGQVQTLKSFTHNMKPSMLAHNFHALRKANKDFKPDICISDYDSFTHAYAKSHNLPILCLDNIQFCARCDIEIEVPKHLKDDYNLCRRLTSMKTPGCDRYLVISTWPGPPVEKDTYKIPPVLREVILNAQPTKGNHMLVYQTSTSQSNLVPELQKCPNITFFVYGMKKDEGHGNVILKNFSEDGFVNDLASSFAVITNGGYSLITEAMYLLKPLCCFPIEGQFEQYLNASYVEKLGYGRCFEEFKGEHVQEFLDGLSKYSDAVAEYKQNGNEQAYAAVDAFIEEFSPKVPKHVKHENKEGFMSSVCALFKGRH